MNTSMVDTSSWQMITSASSGRSTSWSRTSAASPPWPRWPPPSALSEFHFQRLFGRWVGISPKRFLQFLTKEHAHGLLERSRNLLDATYEAGLSGPSRLHDLFVSCEAVTPGEVQRRGEGLTVSYGVHPSPFGRCLLAVTERGICNLHLRARRKARPRTGCARSWPAPASRKRSGADLGLRGAGVSLPPRRGPRAAAPARARHQLPDPGLAGPAAHPLGAAVSYEDLARFVGLPGGARAVGNAVGTTPSPS